MDDDNQNTNNNSSIPISIIDGSISVCQVEVPCSSEENDRYKKEVIVDPCVLTGKTTFINCSSNVAPQLTHSMFSSW